jgi:hypothetical protein
VGLGVALLLASCTSASDDTTTTSAEPSTTVTTGTTTTVSTSTTATTVAPVTSTTIGEDPWSIEYPLDATTVDDLPAALGDRIGGPELDPDLAIEGPDDITRWVDEWLGWFSWINANPSEGIDALEHAAVPGSTFYEDTVAALQDRAADGTRLLGYAFAPMEVSGTFDEFFERGELLRLVVVAADTIPRYVIDDAGAVVSITEPLGGETTLRLLLRQRVEDGEWILENLEVVS